MMAADGLRARYLAWCGSFDEAWARAASWPLGWSAGAAALALLLVAADASDASRAFFGLRLGPVLGLEALALGALLAADRLDARGAFDTATRGLATLATQLLLQLFASGVVALSHAPGSFVLAALPISVAWAMLAFLQSAPHQPFVTLAHGAAMLVACALAPDPAHLAVFAASALIGLGGGTLLAIATLRTAAAQERLAAHRAAVAAQGLAAFAEELEQAKATIAESSGRITGIRRALEESLAACEDLASEGAARGRRPELGEAAGAARRALGRLADVLHPAASPAPEVARAAVLVASVAGEALAEAGRRWPDLSFGVVADGPGAQSARALVRGGASGLRAIVDALVANACEGDGTLGPARVEIRVARVGDRVALDVVDDGPGFPAELLARPISLTGTTKETGSGLGLYTAEGIARGSGGSLTRENLPGGGARVRVLLPDEVAGEGVSR